MDSLILFQILFLDIKEPQPSNTVMPKLVYVYEDVYFDGSKHELLRYSHFGGKYQKTYHACLRHKSIGT